MFGFVMANRNELTEQEKKRYNAVYCGICRNIRHSANQLSRLGLRYDMAFLALLLSSLYEPEETGGERACSLHAVHPRPWAENIYIRYAADMNVALAYYKAEDDWQDENKLSAKMLAGVFGKNLHEIRDRYPRQCAAMEQCIKELSRLEQENCPNADIPANCFGRLMGELLVYQEDLWAPTLRKMGMALGRFIYLADAALDYRRDRKKGRYNPYVQMGTGEDWPLWENHLILAMGKATEEFEKLPLVQDKKILNNILYSGVWCSFAGKKKREDGFDARPL